MRRDQSSFPFPYSNLPLLRKTRSSFTIYWRNTFHPSYFTPRSQPRILLILIERINPGFIPHSLMKTILLIRYVLDNLYKIHERLNIELFMVRRFAFYQHPVDLKGPNCVSRVRARRPQTEKQIRGEKYMLMWRFYLTLVCAFSQPSSDHLKCMKWNAENTCHVK